MAAIDHAHPRTTRRRASLRRAVATAAATAMLGGGLVATTVATPMLQAPAASATGTSVAGAFECGTAGSPTIYATSTARDDRVIYAIDAATGATQQAYVPDPPATGARLNQLAMSADGTRMFWTKGGGATATVSMLVLDGGEQRLVSVPRGAAAASETTMGGYDLATDRYVFGGTASGAAANGAATLTVHAFDPATNAIAANVATAVLEGIPGGNGDLAFSPTGDMYVVAGGAASPWQPGSRDEAQLYRVTGGIPTSGTAVLEAEALGGVIDDVRGLNSIAFGADGSLYLGGHGSSSPAPQLIRVDPASGEVLSRTGVTVGATGAAFAPSDFATCASPSSARGDVELDGPRLDDRDQFALAIREGGIVEDAPGTTGATTGIGATIDGTGPIAGPVAVLAGRTTTVEQTMAPGSAATLGDYATTWQCRDTTHGDVVLAAGEGSLATVTIPRQAITGSDVDCTFTNRALVGALEVEKTVTSGTPTAIGDTIAYGFTVTSTGDVAAVGVVLDDPALANVVCTPGGAPTLEPGASMTCTGSRPSTAEDFAGDGSIVNAATATATTPTGWPITATGTAEVTPDRTPPTPQAHVATCMPNGGTTTIDVVGDGALEPKSVRLVAADGSHVTTLVVAGEGTWSVDEETGAIAFEPEAGGGAATPVEYVVAGPNGVLAASTVAVRCTAAATTVDGGAPEPAASTDAPPLPRTGVDVAVWIVVLGGGLVLGGAVLWLVRRRVRGEA